MKLGVPMAEVAAKLRQLRGNPADFANAEVDIPAADGVFAGIDEMRPGEVGMRFGGPAAASGFYQDGDHEVEVSMSGKRERVDDTTNAEVQTIRAKDDAIPDKALQQLAQMLNARLNTGGGPAGGGGVPNRRGQAGFSKAADEAVEVQLELSIDDPDLQAAYGVVEEQIENRHVKSKERMSHIAIRRFQEVKMQLKSWELEVAYMPCLELNTVVQFTTPPIGDVTYSQTVTGILTALSVNYRSDPKASMKIVVESVEDIGATDYEFANMLHDQNISGTGADTEWTASFTGSGYAQADGGKITLNCGVTGTCSVLGSLFEVDDNEDYNISFDYTNMFGAPQFTFTLEDSGGVDFTINLSGSGSYSKDFTVDDGETSMGLRWAMTDPGAAVEYQIQNVILT
jgi:hypothetical protein